MASGKRRAWRTWEEPEVPLAGDVVVREPREGWSHGFYQAVLQHYVSVRGASPRTARIHPSTVLAVAPEDGRFPMWWPVFEVRRHYAPTRIILSGDAPPMQE